MPDDEVLAAQLARLARWAAEMNAETEQVRIRPATDAEQRAALTALARTMVDAGSGHDCAEWIADGRCQLCERQVRDVMTDEQIRAKILELAAERGSEAAFVSLMLEYHRDPNRPSSRELLYYHLGVSGGVIMRLVAPDLDVEGHGVLFGSMSTPDLVAYYQALTLDRANGADRTFCDGRLALIAAELSRRGETPP